MISVSNGNLRSRGTLSDTYARMGRDVR
jgi:hypothetical protein